MLFNSIEFIIFFLIVFILYFSINYKYRWIVLLISSIYFYMSWNVKYVLLILFVTLVNYLSAIQIENTTNEKKRKTYLTLSIIISFGILFVFKYFNFFNENLKGFLSLFSLQFDPLLINLILPIGISFYTFHNISYVVDVYTNKIKAEKNLGIYTLFVLFFPQLVAGPIQRGKDLIPQIYNKHLFKYEDVISGLKIMLWGFFIKIVIADKLAIPVNMIFNNVHSYTGLSLIIATYFFAIQIFCDFAGYSLIALGSAKMLGYDIIRNFRRPYLANSISDFWSRWHISLTKWFQDYVFNPMYFKLSKMKMLKNKSQTTRHMTAFIVTLIIGEALLGLWHGAKWTYIFFGLYHSILLITYHFIKKPWSKMPTFMQILITFHLTLPGFIFFRSNSLSDAFYVFGNLFTNFSFDITTAGIGLGLFGLFYYLILIMFLFIVEYSFENEKIHAKLIEYDKMWISMFVYIALILWILFFGVFNNTQFIYFQF